jgi:hypothetical protein
VSNIIKYWKGAKQQQQQQQTQKKPKQTNTQKHPRNP